MQYTNLNKQQVGLILLLLFAVSLVIRLPLFNKELTTNWEGLAAHILVTNKAWYLTSPSIHHFNLLFNYPRPEDKFIHNLGDSGVRDQYGNFYYISMPHLGFILPYLFFAGTGQVPSILGLQIFALLVHCFTSLLFYVLLRRVTIKFRASQVASFAGYCVFLFNPISLFYYQNGIFCSSLVVPFTMIVLLAATTLVREDVETKRLPAWIGLAVGLLLGCLTDWHAYFTAFSTAVVFLYLVRKGTIPRTVGLKVVAVCGLCVMSAIIIFCWQNSRIAGFDAFLSTILGRLHERVGKSANGMGLNSFAYYRSLARYYFGYAPFLLAIGCLVTLSVRHGGARSFRTHITDRAAAPLFVSAFAVALDHLGLANHTAAHSYTTIHDTVPMGLLMGFAVAAFLEAPAGGRLRDFGFVCALLVGSVGLEAAIYYVAYLHRPHPFQKSAAEILSASQSSDVMFTYLSGPAEAKPLFYYLGRNIKSVHNDAEAAEFLSCHHLPHGLLITLHDDWTLAATAPVLPAPAGCPLAAR